MKEKSLRVSNNINDPFKYLEERDSKTLALRVNAYQLQEQYN